MTLITRAALFLALGLAACVDTAAVDGPPVPTASRYALTTPEDTTIAVTVGATDPAGDAMAFEASAPQHGKLAGAGPTYTYTPIQNWNGTDTFTVTTSNGLEAIEVPVTITVASHDDAPIAGDDMLSVSADTALEIPFGTLLDNDADVDSSPLLIDGVQDATHGTVALDDTGVTFVPDAGFRGVATFTYTITDGVYPKTAKVSVRVGLPTTGLDRAVDGPLAAHL
jgi:hypothetical protein